VTEQYYRWYSPNLNHDVEMLVFGDRGYPVILFPTSQGRYFQNKDEGLIDSVRWFIDEGLVKIYCPDSLDWLTWYNKSIHPADRAKNYAWYDKMLYDELIPWAMHGRLQFWWLPCCQLRLKASGKNGAFIQYERRFRYAAVYRWVLR